MDEGRKDDNGKLPLELIPYDVIEEGARALQFGAKKYAPRNWEKGMKWSRLFAALMRHMWAWFRGQELDPETGLSHLAHAWCCVTFLLAYHLRKVGEDDRPVAAAVPPKDEVLVFPRGIDNMAKYQAAVDFFGPEGFRVHCGVPQYTYSFSKVGISIGWSSFDSVKQLRRGKVPGCFTCLLPLHQAIQQ